MPKILLINDFAAISNFATWSATEFVLRNYVDSTLARQKARKQKMPYENICLMAKRF